MSLNNQRITITRRRLRRTRINTIIRRIHNRDIAWYIQQRQFTSPNSFNLVLSTIPRNLANRLLTTLTKGRRVTQTSTRRLTPAITRMALSPSGHLLTRQRRPFLTTLTRSTRRTLARISLLRHRTSRLNRTRTTDMRRFRRNTITLTS